MCHHRGRTQTNVFESYLVLRHTPLAGQLRIPSHRSPPLPRPRPVGWSRGPSGYGPWSFLVPPLFESAVVVEDGKSALGRRRQDNAVAQDGVVKSRSVDYADVLR